MIPLKDHTKNCTNCGGFGTVSIMWPTSEKLPNGNLRYQTGSMKCDACKGTGRKEAQGGLPDG